MTNHYAYAVLLTYLVLFFVYWYGRKTKQWKWSEYFLMTIAPFLALVLLVFLEGSRVIGFFVLSAVFGFLAEFLLGLFFDKTLGKKLWVYKKLSIRGYTSPLALPFWGAAGFLFLSIAKLLNL